MNCTCGHEPTMEIIVNPKTGGCNYIITCSSCRRTTKKQHTRQQAINAWERMTRNASR